MHFPQQLWLCTHPTDMRKSFDGLVALVRNHLQDNPTCGQGFIFVNKTRSLMKCLYFEPGGFCIWSKRLEQGRFASLAHHNDGVKIALSETEFSALIEGFDLEIKKRRKRYTLPG
ncbi:MAG TPA: transposase [Gammaproteobacteria bacterium]|nr:transposase [Gammaproteobacteria bacterium]